MKEHRNAPLIQPQESMDATSLEDVILMFAANIERALIKSGAIPGIDYSRNSLIEMAHPYVIAWANGSFEAIQKNEGIHWPCQELNLNESTIITMPSEHQKKLLKFYECSKVDWACDKIKDVDELNQVIAGYLSNYENFKKRGIMPEYYGKKISGNSAFLSQKIRDLLDVKRISEGNVNRVNFLLDKFGER